SRNAPIAYQYSDVIRRRIEAIPPTHTLETGFNSLVYGLFLLECHKPELVAAAASIANESGKSLNNLSYRLLHALLHIQSSKRTVPNSNHRILAQRAISICETYGFKLLEAYCRVLILKEVPKEEQIQHVNSLK